MECEEEAPESEKAARLVDVTKWQVCKNAIEFVQRN